MNRDWMEYALPREFRDSQHALGAVGLRGYRTNELTVIVAKEPSGWHLSISAPGRYPSWDEIADARYDLLPDEITMAMLLPPRSQYVNLHPTTFHLHQVDDEEQPDEPAMLRSHESGLVLP